MASRRLFIANAHPGGNLGAEAMLSVLVTQLKSWPEILAKYDIWIEMISDSPAYADFAERHGLAANFFRFSPRHLGPPYDIRPGSDDVLIDIGGIAYADGGAAIGALRNYRRHRYFASRGTRLIFFTQDFGPAYKPITKWLAKLAMAGVETFFARSLQSKENLEATVPNVPIAGPYPDCTFALEPSRLPAPLAEKRYVVIVPSAMMWNSHGEHYLEVLFEVAVAVPSDVTVLLMVHNFTLNGSVDDKFVCDLVAQNLASSRRVEVHCENSTPAELKAILRGAKAVISSRYHALVGAMTSDTPAYAIGWSHKYSEFLKLYGLEDWSLNLQEVPRNKIDRKNVAQSILCKLDSEERAANIASTNRALKAEVDASFVKLRSLLNA